MSCLSTSTTADHFNQRRQGSAAGCGDTCAYMRRTKNVLTAPWASPVASTATVVRLRRLPGTRRTTILEGVLQVGFQETSQERLERGVVGNRSQCERSAQLSVFAQTNFGFAEGPVLVAHEAQDSQQLRLRELAFAKAGAVGRHDLSHIQSHLREAPQTHFGQ